MCRVIVHICCRHLLFLFPFASRISNICLFNDCLSLEKSFGWAALLQVWVIGLLGTVYMVELRWGDFLNRWPWPMSQGCILCSSRIIGGLFNVIKRPISDRQSVSFAINTSIWFSHLWWIIMIRNIVLEMLVHLYIYWEKHDSTQNN